MALVRDIEFFKRALVESPSLRVPVPLVELASMEQRSREWRSALRSYDAARLELGIRTPAQIQSENSLFTGLKPELASFHAFAET
jgi:hypothetical protein